MSVFRIRERLGNAIETGLDKQQLRRAPGLPEQVHLSVTDRCFLPCLHCDIWKNTDVDLPTDFWLDVIDQLGEWCAPAGMNFVGGEPLLRQDLEELIGRAHHWGFTTSFNTNAWLLNEKRVQKIAESKIDLVYVSLDGFTASTVDHSRGREGSFEKAMEAIQAFQMAGVTVSVASVLHSGNAEELVELADWLHERGMQMVVQPLYQNFGNVEYNVDWWKDSPFFPKSPSEIESLCDVLDTLTRYSMQGRGVVNPAAQFQAMKFHFSHPTKDAGVSCRAGHSDISIDPQGRIRLCYFLEPVGNFNDGVPLDKIWNAHRTMNRRWNVSRCDRNCSLLNCNFEREDS